MRLDLAADLRARIGAPDKDARLTNAFVEVKAGPVAKNSAYPAKKETCVRKRPGCATTGYDYTTPIQGIGGSLPYLIYDDTFGAFDAVPATSVLIGDLVGGYYAMVDDPPTSPGPGDDYWSVTPPGSTRYKSQVYIDNALGPGDLHITMSDGALTPWVGSQMQGPIAASRAATLKKLFDDVSLAGGVISWNYVTIGDPPVGSSVYRIIPAGTDSVGTSSDFYLSSPSTVNWSAGYNTAAVGAATVLQGYALDWAVSWYIQSASLTIQSTGNVARIPFASLPFSSAGIVSRIVRWVRVSGSAHPEYNGTFDVDLADSSSNSFSTLTGNLYYTMASVPSSATTTATVEYCA
jgi:hypothetical protein